MTRLPAVIAISWLSSSFRASAVLASFAFATRAPSAGAWNAQRAKLRNSKMNTLRSHGFNQRPRFEQVVGYLERNEPLPLDQPDRKATTFVTSHFYLDDFVQSSEDPNPQPL